MTAVNEESNAIKDIEFYSAGGDSNKKFVNYPYGNTHKVCNRVLKTTGSFTKKITQSNYSKKIDKNFISPSYIRVRERKLTGYILIPSLLCQTLCEGNPILYKNNIYVPLNQ